MANLQLLLPYKNLKEESQVTLGEDYLVKFQGMVSHNDKQLLVTVLPDRTLFTLLLQQAIKQTADYVRTNNLTYSPESTRQLLTFICGGPFTCPPRPVSLGHDNGAGTSVLDAPQGSTDQPAHVHQSPQSRPAKKDREEKIRLAAKRTKRAGSE
jgi:hypothetical protein